MFPGSTLFGEGAQRNLLSYNTIPKGLYSLRSDCTLFTKVGRFADSGNPDASDGHQLAAVS